LKGKYFSATDPTTNGRFNEIIGHETDANRPAYDLNGNIRNLFRNGKTGLDAEGKMLYGEMDELSYSYEGNQLIKVADSKVDTEGFKETSNEEVDYAYDLNGNMHMDKNKDLQNQSINYNHLNLPMVVEKSSTEKVEYVYDASGRKLRQISIDGATTKTTDYVGEFVYENNILQFINHEEGRIVMISTPEYQYHLKDHLGNVRATFTSADEETEAPLATMETANENEERAKFLKYDDVRKVNHPLFDHTNQGSTKFAIRLTGTAEETYGLAQSVSVMPGDKIKAEAYAKYLDPSQVSSQSTLGALIAQISGAEPGLVLDGAGYGTAAAATIPVVSFLNKSNETGEAPKAYLNWLVFDKDYNPIPGKSGYKRVSTAAKETGAGIDQAPEGNGHEFLQSPPIEIDEAGYVYIYLSNEEQGLEVYFDDFEVEQVKSNIIQSDDYYPFGLTFNSYSRESTTLQDFNFNGKELQNELSLGWIDYGARMYMPEVGRWGAMDPLTELMRRHSPYSYAFNNPVRLIDLEGMVPGQPIASKFENTGNVLIILSDEPDMEWDTRSMDESSWDYVVARNLQEASDWVANTYGEDGSGIDNLVVRSHGGTSTDNSVLALPNGSGGRRYLFPEDFSNGDNVDVTGLSIVSKYLNQDATVLFSACSCNFFNDNLSNAIFKALNGFVKNLTLYTNKASTGMTSEYLNKKTKSIVKRGVVIGKPLVAEESRWAPFIKTTRQGAFPMEKGSSLMLGQDGSVGTVAPKKTDSIYHPHKFIKNY
jgi:RHS repeat-associated protein